MERIKALLAVTLFVAGLIFATPMTDKNSLEKLSIVETNKQKKRVDTTSTILYKIQPVNSSDISENIH